MTRRFGRGRATAAVALGAVVAASAFGAVHDAARAQDAVGTSGLGGFQGTASSSGLHVFYTPEGLLPLGSVVDLGAPNALATIASGPATFARASAADPGDLLANPDALLALGAPGYQAGTLPPYPYRVTATSGFGEPSAESTPAPGLGATVEAEPNGSTAAATMPRGAAPAVATFGSMSSRSTTSTDGSTVTVHARSVVSDFDLLGVLVIDSIVTDLQATSDGTSVTLTGGTTVSGASVLGQAVTIDAKGVHGPGPEGGPPDPGSGGLTGAINDGLATVLGATTSAEEALADAGISVTLAKPVSQGGEGAGQRSSSGLRIALELSDRTMPALTTLAEAVPPIPGLAPGAPTTDDLIAAVRARHLTRVEVAPGAVALSATPAAEPFVPAAVTPPPAGGAALPDTALPPVGATAPAAAPAGSSGTGATAAAPVAALPEVPLAAGIGALAALVLLVQPFVGARIARMAETVLAAGDGVSCPLEDR